MPISRIRVVNFRSIKAIDESISPICALIGPNNAGKSNILRSIQRVLEKDWLTRNSFTEEDVYGRDPDKDIEITLELDPPYEYQRFKEAEPVDISSIYFEFTRYKIGPNAGERRLEQKCFGPEGDAPVVLAKAPKKGERRKFETLYSTPKEVRENNPLIYIGSNRTLRSQLPGSRYSVLRQLFESIDQNLQDPENKIKVKRIGGEEIEVTRLERFHRLMQEAMKVLRTDQFNELERTIKVNALKLLGFDPVEDEEKLNLFFSPFDTFEFYKSLDLQIGEGEMSISATEVGDGLQNAIIMAMLQALESHKKKGAIFLIEEPEMFLHPQMQRSLYKTLRELGKTNQVIYTTHSPHFVAIPEYDEVILVRKDQEGTSLRRSDLDNNDVRREKLIKEFDPERNEMFFATRLLLVEGDTEKLAFPEYANRLGFDVDRAGATIVEVGGKRNLVEFAKIASSFKIPTGIVYDKDSSEFKDDRESENEYNAKLDSFKTADGVNEVWRFDKNFEDELRNAMGEETYQAYCQRFPNTRKPTRARLIALDKDSQIPEIFQEIVNWLVKKPVDE
ncbi:MAG: DUF2813 domain-containing protein [Acidobacteria bacterium]|nr:MAG: DUF2813 domain-containing protein [Acidobacteriota bacterium]REJ98282.1 MAG: DUF2813 domain-containing protein [Acidobacteriota bacterium]REK17026.1 MAG: DUF2813 domain-containing protein [Acidobacteriota bacterium]REK42936.1 MAG: DUF2813 domain-containing protein [Acidobacteriota bacterium]